ncbi:unnamed protein product [Rhodiola kirilowii]
MHHSLHLNGSEAPFGSSSSLNTLLLELFTLLANF